VRSGGLERASDDPWGNEERRGDCKWPAPSSIVKARITDNPSGASFSETLGLISGCPTPWTTGEGCCCWVLKRT
jgi:hypothetical protein